MKIINSDQIPENWYKSSSLEEFDIVKQILEEVRQNGDKAVRQYSKKFDGLGDIPLEISEEEIREAYNSVDPKLVSAMKKAAYNIEQFAKAQKEMFQDLEIKTEFGRIGHRIIPLSKVGCYVPGGMYPLPSTALMTVIPAKVAGVEEIIVCSPKIKPETIVAANLAGATRIFRVGGVQAIGALAYGTETIPNVEKIVGPGNRYVTFAKKEVFGEVGIDFLAGPSEILVIGDCSADPALIAADLLSQAEHDEFAEANAILCCVKLAEEVKNEIYNQLELLPTKKVAQASISKGFLVVCQNLKDMAQIVNKKAPEHLELMIGDPSSLLPNLKNFGSLFIGRNSAEVFGDYSSGPNHVLPTGRGARYTGGLSVKDFLKIATFQEIEDPRSLIEISSVIAEVEGLIGHRNAALKR